MQRTAVGFSGFLHYSSDRIVRLCNEAEQLGYESLWVAETRFVDDGMTLLASLSMVTKKVKLGNCILGHTFARTPVLLALSAATLDIMSRGRAFLGLGPGASYYVSKQGVKVGKPLQALREYVVAIRQLLAGDEVTFHGDFVHVDGVTLGVRPLQKQLPIYLGVSGPNMLRMAGQVADGIILNALVTPDYIRKAIELVRQGAQESKREISEVEITSVIYVSMSDDAQSALDALKPMLADYFVHQPHTARDSGLEEATLRKILVAWKNGGQEAAAKEVPNSTVQAINAAGTPGECRHRIDEYRKAGVELPILLPLPPNPELILRELSR